MLYHYFQSNHVMNTFYKIIFSSCFLFFTYSYSFGQNTGSFPSTQQTPQQNIQATIIGKVVDQNTKAPLDYATVSLYSQNDSTLVTGGITDDNGEFEIKTGTGVFYAKVDYIAYQSKFIADIVVEDENTELDLGVIELSDDAALLDVIEVRAEKSQMQMTLDKRVFNVGKDLANRGGTADDLLNNIPSVSVDVEGNVSLRGNENVRILIDGRPSGLVGIGDSNGLRQFPTSMIDRVEVVTNPSARYEAEGVAGIINIILKKDNRRGLNGSFDVNVGHPATYGGAVNLNYRTKNINLFGSYGLNYRTREGGGSYFQEFYKADTTFILDQNRSHERGGLSNTFRFGSDFFINPKNTLTAALTYRLSDENNISDVTYNDYVNKFPDNFLGVTYRTDDEKEDESSLEYSLNYKKTFDKEDHVLTALVRYEDDIETEKNAYLETFYGSDFLPTGEPNLQQRAINQENNREWMIQVDYVHPFSKEGKFEAGIRSSIRNIDNNYVVEELNDIQWDTIFGLTNDFDYDEYIHAAYMTFGNKYGKFSFLAGLRAELSDINTRLIQTNEVNDRNYFNFFPTLHLTYDLPRQNAVQVSYSRRINRPRYRSLNPFLSFSDSRNLYQGNPDLDPEFTNSMEIGHIKYWDNATLTSSLYYRQTEGVVQRIRTINDQGNTITRPENLATEDAFGVEATFSYKPKKWLNLDGDFNFFRSIVDGTNLGETFKSDNYTWRGRLSSRLTFPNLIDFQARFNYRAPNMTTQGTTKAIYFFDLAISKDVFKSNGTITLSVNDLFNTRKRRYTTFGPDFYAEGEFQWRARQITMTFNYRINQMKRQRPNGGSNYEGGGGDEGGF